MRRLFWCCFGCIVLSGCATTQLHPIDGVHPGCVSIPGASGPGGKISPRITCPVWSLTPSRRAAPILIRYEKEF